MIIAVDFDGVLFEDRFPDIGAPNYEVLMFVRRLMDEGHELILWTSRTGDRLAEAVRKCEDYGLHFVSVNENAPSNRDRYSEEYPFPSPKVYADLYLDDNDPWFQQSARASNNSRKEALDVMIKYTRRAVDIFVNNERNRRRQEALNRAREEIGHE